jgi:hypothetical protein
MKGDEKRNVDADRCEVNNSWDIERNKQVHMFVLSDINI